LPYIFMMKSNNVKLSSTPKLTSCLLLQGARHKSVRIFLLSHAYYISFFLT
jgi:hypothetical protein